MNTEQIQAQMSKKEELRLLEIITEVGAMDTLVQQAQTIAEVQRYGIFKIKEKDLVADDFGWLVKYKDHKAIVDSQAQKISEQEKQLGLMTLGIRSRDVKIAEQAKDIEKLKASLSI